MKPVLETTCIKRPPALRYHCSDTTTLLNPSPNETTVQSMMSRNLISHVCKTRKFVMAILHQKQGLLCDKNEFQTLAKCKQKIDLIQPFPNDNISDCSKLKEFADDNSNFIKMAESYSNG